MKKPLLLAAISLAAILLLAGRRQKQRIQLRLKQMKLLKAETMRVFPLKQPPKVCPGMRPLKTRLFPGRRQYTLRPISRLKDLS